MDPNMSVNKTNQQTQSAFLKANKPNQPAGMKTITDVNLPDVHHCDIQVIESGASEPGNQEGGDIGVLVKCEQGDNFEVHLEGEGGGVKCEEKSKSVHQAFPETKPKKARALTPVERKQLSRATQSSTKKEAEKLLDRERKKKKRDELKIMKVPMTAAERKRASRAAAAQSNGTEVEKTTTRVRVAKYRANQSEEEKEAEKEKTRERVANYRVNLADEEKLYGKIAKRQNMREMRQSQTGKNKLISNLKAKKGMKLFREEGRLKEFEKRNSTPLNKKLQLDNDLSEWNWFKESGPTNAEMLKRKKPDVVSQLNEAWRKKKEKDDEAKKKEKRAEENEWLYNPENDEYFWNGNEEPKYGDTEFCYDAPTKEENDAFSTFMEEDYKYYFDELKKGKKEEAKRKREEKKKEINAPLDPLPERPLSDYEKIREANIKEREIAMKEAGIF